MCPSFLVGAHLILIPFSQSDSDANLVGKNHIGCLRSERCTSQPLLFPQHNGMLQPINVVVKTLTVFSISV